MRTADDRLIFESYIKSSFRARKKTLGNPTFRDLVRLASQFGIEIEDDKLNTTLYAHAPEGMAWEDGELHSLIEPYGRGDSYMRQWREEAMAAMFDRIKQVGPLLEPIKENVE